MSNGIKGLTEVKRDDHYIRVAREQFCNRLENSDKSCSRGSSWTESILIRAAQVDGRLENCWINELLDNDTLECSAQDGSHRNRSKVRVFLWRSGLGNRCNRCQLPLLGKGRSSDRHIEQAGKRPTKKTGAPRRKNHAGSKYIPVAVLRSLSRISNIPNSVISAAVSARLETVSLRFGTW